MPTDDSTTPRESERTETETEPNDPPPPTDDSKLVAEFSVPTDAFVLAATLKEVAEKLGISSKAASERLRRGQTNLISNTLTIGRPTGVGVGD